VRSDIEWIDATRGIEHATARLIESPHTRLLVCDGELDQMLGIVQSGDLLSSVLQGRALNVTDFVREPLVVPEGTSTLRVLEQIRAHPIPLAVVVDEYGSLEGMVTANDLLATIAGDLVDTQDADYAASRGDDGIWLVDGSMSLQDLEHTTGIVLPREATYVTLSGLVLHLLDRMPVEGDTVTVGAWQLQVESLERRRVGKLRIAPVPDEG
jgi:CBS domain containing-hemolysin-like protein